MKWKKIHALLVIVGLMFALWSGDWSSWSGDWLFWPVVDWRVGVACLSYYVAGVCLVFAERPKLRAYQHTSK